MPQSTDSIRRMAAKPYKAKSRPRLANCMVTYIPWEVVNLLANLPNLEVLKGEGAFSGTDWKLDEDVVFHKLKYLQLYGCYDLERQEAAGSDNFPMLKKLLLYWLYELEEIPESIGDTYNDTKIDQSKMLRLCCRDKCKEKSTTTTKLGKL
ncbi:hypothetical protein H5410_022323 [Solanum commersonii]|uniref:Late blight resistance protein n=1 Tax=Solanum commersonii TaxID=4109 RepID=A0A9J5ZEG4_SOLCO|nr:hypothetical protein H5410_022323 [Solanum commersonii]